jgi:hypothetical protein
VRTRIDVDELPHRSSDFDGFVFLGLPSKQRFYEAWAYHPQHVRKQHQNYKDNGDGGRALNMAHITRSLCIAASGKRLDVTAGYTVDRRQFLLRSAELFPSGMTEARKGTGRQTPRTSALGNWRTLGQVGVISALTPKRTWFGTIMISALYHKQTSSYYFMTLSERTTSAS